MALSGFSAFSGFIPAATGQVISFIRDPKNYKLNDYAQLVETKKKVGVYHRLGVDQPVRMTNIDSNVWEDGKDRPPMHGNQLKFDAVEFSTIRRTEGFTIGWQAIEQADMKLLVTHSAMAHNQLMVKRTQRAVTLLETTSNWGNNTDTVTNLNGGRGRWDTASSDPDNPNYLAIKRSLDAAMLRVMLGTNGMMSVNDKASVRLLISPNVAQKISNSAEIHDYISKSPYALAQITGDKPGQNAQWGLPDKLYGWDIIVEDACKVTQNANSSEAIGSEASTTGASPARRFIKNDTSAIVMSRVGGLDGQYGAPSFSTLQLYWLNKEIEIESFDDPKQRYTQGYVTEDVKEVLAAPASGFCITDLVAA